MKSLINDKAFQRLTFVFIVISVAAFLLKGWLEQHDIDYKVVLFGNLIIYAASLLAVILYTKSSAGGSAHSVTRMVYAGFVTKFFILVTTAMVYFYFAENINVRGVFVCLGIYLVYNFLGAGTAARKHKIKNKKHHHAK